MDQTFPILARLVSPEAIHDLDDRELRALADEVRAAILANVSQTGGHLSSNLGTVELTVALYASFKLPTDTVVWDTGHQAYPHKLLTGRLDRFGTLRKEGGLSGFLRRDESPYDAFGAGHAGTAISAALGFSEAKARLGEEGKVVAITGDSAIANGMCWEALNHGGDTKANLTVVLNDNRMSIAPGVGALHGHLARLRAKPWLQDAAQKAKGLVEKMPEPVARAADGLRHGITHYLAPEETGALFEEMGWEYIGPFDGHDLPTLLSVFRSVRELNGPVFVHAMTVKGKGYAQAEADSRKWHGVVPFDPQVGELTKASGPVTYMQAFGESALELAAADPKIVAITAAMPDGTGLAKFSNERPGQYVDVGIAEAHGVTLAAGMAAGGLKPLVAIYSTFLQRAFDSIVHDVALQRLPVRFFLDRAGLVGDDGPTHHGVLDLAYLLPIPGMTVLAPRDVTELREMARWMAAYDDGPCAMRYPRGAGDDRLPESRSPIVRGKAEILVRPARPNVALIALGSTVAPSWEAASLLREQSIEATVVNARFAKPLDEATILEVVREAGAVLVAEEAAPHGGFGDAVAKLLRENGLASLPFAHAALPDAFIEHGSQPSLRRSVGLDAPGLVSRVLQLVGQPSREGVSP
ncbi:1-deoxy-D-xylulose-5-phosphate synthase [bacterium]|nr:MAG: 1-deoxy-D-xylulose-5-phosphate synthase [bacterium]